VDPTVLDTDVASLLHRGTLAGPLATRLIGREPLITFVTFGELAKWAEIRNWGQRRREELTSWLSRIAVLPGDEAVAAWEAEWCDLLAALRRAADTELTVRQREVFVAIVLNGVPLDTLVLELGSSRGAIYKMMFDARRKLRAALAANGYMGHDTGGRS